MPSYNERLGLGIIASYAAFSLAACSHNVPVSTPQPIPPVPTLVEITQPTEVNLSRELADLLETHHASLPSFRDLQYSAPFARVPNTSHGAVAYRRTIVDKELFDSRSEFREDIRAGRVRILSFDPDLSVPLDPIGTIEESLYLYPPEAIISTHITRLKDRIVFGGVNYSHFPNTEIYTDPEMDGKFNKSYNGPMWHHGVPDSVFVDIGTLDAEKAAQSQQRFEELIRTLSAAVKEAVNKRN